MKTPSSVNDGVPSGIHFIPATSYLGSSTSAKHVFLVGNLQRPSDTPFFRDERVEWIVCRYDADDDGQPHWHDVVTEYEMVTDGTVGYLEIATDTIHWFRAGDFFTIPRGVCVKRLVPDRATSIVIKIPSRSDKVHCDSCERVCLHRLEPFRMPCV